MPLILLLLSLCLPLGLWAQPKIPPRPEPATYINDYAKILPEEERKALETMLNAHFQAGGPQIVFMSISSLGDYSELEIAQAIFDKWGIGRKDKNDGILILVALKQKRFRIHTGYGMEGVLSDAQANRLLEKHLEPAFKQGNYAQGVRGLIMDLKRLESEGETARISPSLLSKPWASLGLISLMALLFLMAYWAGQWQKAGEIKPALIWVLYALPLFFLLFCWLTPRYGFRLLLFVIIPLQGLSFFMSTWTQARWRWQGYLLLGHYGLLFWSLYHLPDLSLSLDLDEKRPWYFKGLILSTAILVGLSVWNHLGLERLLHHFHQQYGLPKVNLRALLPFHLLGAMSLLLALGASESREIEALFQGLGFWAERHAAYQELAIMGILGFVLPLYLWTLRRHSLLPYPLLQDAVLGLFPPTPWGKNLRLLDAEVNGQTSNWWQEQQQRFKAHTIEAQLAEAWEKFRHAGWDNEAQKKLGLELEQIQAAPGNYFDLLPQVALEDQRIALQQFCSSPELPATVKNQLEQAFAQDLSRIAQDPEPQKIIEKWTNLCTPFPTSKKSDTFFAYTLVAKVASPDFEQALWAQFQRNTKALNALEKLRQAFQILDVWNNPACLSLATVALAWYEGTAPELLLREDVKLKELYDYAAKQWAQPYRLEAPRKALATEIEQAYQALLPHFDSDGYLATDKRTLYEALLARLQEVQTKLNELLPYDAPYLMREVQRRQHSSTWGLNLDEYSSSSIQRLEQRILAEIKALEQQNWPLDNLVWYYFHIINYPFYAYLDIKPKPSTSGSSSSSKSHWTYSGSSSSASNSSSSSSSSHSRSSFGGGSSGGGGASGGW